MFSRRVNAVTLSLMLVLLFSFSTAIAAEDDGAAAARAGLKEAAGVAGLSNTGGSEELPSLVGIVVGSLLSITGVAFFLLSLYGGFLWMTARGNDQQIEQGRNTLKAAIIGIIVVVASYAITSLVLEAYKETPKREEAPAPGTPSAPAAPESGRSEGGDDLKNVASVTCCVFRDQGDLRDHARVVQSRPECYDICSSPMGGAEPGSCTVTYVDSESECR